MSDTLPKNFTVYRSSAGSGKTYTLVKEYLKIILVEPAKFRNILAITFTIKAANEMKDRILENLHELSEYSIKSNSRKIKGLLDSLVVETGLTQEEIITTSRNALSLILHNYSDFSISTIDSFVHRVIRSFALDLDLSMNFEVEMDTDELISKCIDLLLDKTGNDKELTKVLLNYIKYKSLEDRSLDIDYDLNKFANTLNKEVVQNYLEDFRKLKPEDFENVTKKTRDFIRQFETYISNIASKACKSISNKEISPSSFFQARSGIAVYFKRLSENNFDKLQPNKNVTKTIEEDKWTSAKTTQEDKLNIEDIKGELISAYGNIKGRMDSDFSRYETYKLLNRNIYLLAVLNLIEKVIDEFKKQNNLILISEFNKKISEIVFSEPVPFIYERLGERYKHFFIDEFQDTSVLQWMNLLPLLDNSLAEGNFNMVVGDGKQAIYRFRNGEIEQFVRLPKLVDKTNNPINLEREQSLKR
ncbi:MAG: UvrD-helicase domain-containing protein, partial [Bacteroidales bacterium]|nr:UvrD-helicase domain-containing protein [Bacteroidales bacterium]